MAQSAHAYSPLIKMMIQKRIYSTSFIALMLAIQSCSTEEVHDEKNVEDQSSQILATDQFDDGQSLRFLAL